MLQFQFDSYGENANGPKITSYAPFKSDSGARSYAGRLAKKTGGPVDLARAGDADWSVRYLTTAEPSDFHVSGYRFGRLD